MNGNDCENLDCKDDGVQVADEVKTEEGACDGENLSNGERESFLVANEEKSSFYEDETAEKERARLNEERLKIYREQCAVYNYRRERGFNRTPLILALIGLILSVFFGVGICFSVPALVLSATRIKKKQSRTLKWALTVSIITTFVCAVIICSLGYAVVAGVIEYYEIIGETQGVISRLIG